MKCKYPQHRSISGNKTSKIKNKQTKKKTDRPKVSNNTETSNNTEMMKYCIAIKSHACKICNETRKCLLYKQKIGHSVTPTAKNSIFCLRIKCSKNVHDNVNSRCL